MANGEGTPVQLADTYAPLLFEVGQTVSVSVRVRPQSPVLRQARLPAAVTHLGELFSGGRDNCRSSALGAVCAVERFFDVSHRLVVGLPFA